MQTAALDRRVDARGYPYFWIGFKRVRSNPHEGTDLRAIYDGRISVTPLHLNLTERGEVRSGCAVRSCRERRSAHHQPDHGVAQARHSRRAVLSVIERMPRDAFVDEPFAHHA